MIHKAKSNYKKIDLNKSFIHFKRPKNSWRSNIKSILTFENNSFFLVKECMAELVGRKPFYQTPRYEYLVIEDNYSTSVFRKFACDFKKSNLSHRNLEKNKKNILMTNIEYLSFKKVNKIVSSNEPINIFCEIDFKYNGRKYNLITKCEYINYNSDKNDEKYLQPIMGYVPFISNNILNYGYVVIKINEKFNNNLEFLLSEKKPLFTYDKKNIIRNCISFIFALLPKSIS